MSSLADLPELVGFFSYARSDDENSDKALSSLRKRIRNELRLQLGRELRLWQDTEAIPHGTLWKYQIHKAIAESAFFIPVITPSAVNSSYCRMEFEAFLDRESELRRDDLVFPILYIRVPALANEDQCSRDHVLKIIHARQYADWTKIRLDDLGSPEVGKQIARFCEDIVGALHKPWKSPEERRRKEEVKAFLLEAERRREEAEQRGKEEEHSGVGTMEEARPGPASPKEWQPSRRALAAGGLLGVVLFSSILAWLVIPWEPVSPPVAGPILPPPGDAPPPSVRPDQPATGLIRSLSPERERALKPKDSFKECDKCPEMVVVPAGSFMMGSPSGEAGDADESPSHVVAISKPFAVGKLHVTVDQFTAFVTERRYDAGSKCWTLEGGKAEERSGRSWRNPGFTQDGSHPAVCLSWDEANAYAEWLAEKTDKPYRLLTEAEWEYAARGRTMSTGVYPRFWFGNNEKDLCRFGNGADQTARDRIVGAKGWAAAPCNDGYVYTSPAGHFEANAFGLHDMFGNAWQWTADCY